MPTNTHIYDSAHSHYNTGVWVKMVGIFVCVCAQFCVLKIIHHNFARTLHIFLVQVQLRCTV